MNIACLGEAIPPTCEEGQQLVYGAARHEMLEVPCSVLAHPTPTSFRWAVNTSTGVVDVALNLSSSAGSRSVVRYTPQTHHDFGELLCWAVNDLGLQHQPCVFKVVPAAKPESVSRCDAERNATMPASYVVLSCAAGWDGGLNQTFTLEVRQAAKEEVLEAFRHASEPLFIVSGLKIGVEYLLTVTAANARGSSPPVTINYTATAALADKVVSPHSHTNTLLSLTSFLMVVAGVVALATCFSVGVVAVKRRRNHNKKKVSQTMFTDPMQVDIHNHDHTIVCVKECEKEELVKSHTPSGVVSNLYVTPSALLNNRVGPPQETEVLLQERTPCAPLVSLNSLGRYSSSTSKTSTSTSSSSSTVALNPEFLAKNPDYKISDYRHTALPDFIMRTSDSFDLSPEYPTLKAEYLVRTPEYVIRNLDCLALNSECLARNHECPSRNPECPARNPLCPVRSLECPARTLHCPSGNPGCGSRYQSNGKQEEGARLLPPHRESSV
ncbi:hypothetical protein Pmani_023449 [Petrolisthes manimaculis]|uniref:Fibronectin type-III domain-containing protein n=1 Tax=Petrolisthes manimaculis TaxID=1843537 RepID=A0AAE1P9S8_9EUCA|nr:hypothetical protein Pmani_023449 [Petrolisthes manimaculis]